MEPFETLSLQGPHFKILALGVKPRSRIALKELQRREKPFNTTKEEPLGE